MLRAQKETQHLFLSRTRKSKCFQNTHFSSKSGSEFNFEGGSVCNFPWTGLVPYMKCQSKVGQAAETYYYYISCNSHMHAAAARSTILTAAAAAAGRV